MFLDRVLAFTITVPIVGDRRQYDSFNAYLADLIQLAIWLGAAIGVLIIVYAGFLYVTSGGDDSKIKTAKDLIIGSISGLVLLLTIRVLAPLLGVLP